MSRKQYDRELTPADWCCYLAIFLFLAWALFFVEARP